MADSALEGLNPATTPLTGDELIYGTQGGDSVRMTVDEVRGPNLKSLADLTLSQGDLLYINADGDIERLPKGASGQVLRQNAGLTAPEWWSPPFTKYYESSQQTITTGGLLTLAHGLGAEPKLVDLEAVCVTADGGYAVGENMKLTGAADHVGAAQAHGQSVRKNSTNVLVRFGSNSFCALAINPTNGNHFSPTAANWRLIVRAWL